MDSPNVLFAFGLTLLAGLATGIGSGIAFFARTTNTRFLSISLGFSAGVMIYVSLVEIFSKARIMLSEAVGDPNGYWITVGAFFSGMILIAIIDRMVPEMENPHELKRIEEGEHPSEAFRKKKLLRMGTMSALVIGIHNFPEGLATFTAALSDPTLAIAIAVAIAIHNIPEGIAVSVPVYYSTGNRKKAFWLSFMSGLSEPLGALIGYLLLMPYLNDITFGILFASVAGIMVFISIDELLPAAREYGQAHLSIYGVISGMIIMAVSLLLFS